jgi:metal-responsive CopG/Arc/MetJ family transcriptional regulator
MSKKKKFTEMVGVMFTSDTLNDLEKITDELEISKSEFIRDIIEQQLAVIRKKETEQ